MVCNGCQCDCTPSPRSISCPVLLFPRHILVEHGRKKAQSQGGRIRVSIPAEVTQKLRHSAAELIVQGVVVPARFCPQGYKIPHCQLCVAPSHFQKNNL